MLMNKLNKNYQILEVNETEAGFIIGQKFATEIQKAVSSISVLNKNFYSMKQKLIKTYPDYYQEVCDRARGANVDLDKYLTYVSCELREQAMEKCTDIMIKKDDGTILLGHNEDGEYNKDNTLLVKHLTKNGWYIEFACIDSLAGTTYWWNSSGLIFTMNYIHTNHYQELGEISSWFVLRDIVESTSLNGVLEKIKKVKSASGFNINLVDTKTNKAYSIEYYVDRIDVVEITNKFVHTSHFLHLEKGYCPEGNNTFNRLEHCHQILDKADKNIISFEDIKTILEYRNSDYMHTVHVNAGDNKKIKENLTSSLFLFDSNQKEIQIYNYINQQKIIFEI